MNAQQVVSKGRRGVHASPQRLISPTGQLTPLQWDVRVCPSGWGDETGRTCPLDGLLVTPLSRVRVAVCLLKTSRCSEG